MSPHQSGDHHGHEMWYKENHVGRQDWHPNVVPYHHPFCKEFEDKMKACLAEQNSYYCRMIIRAFNDCKWRSEYMSGES